jgi:integrase
MGSLSDIQLRSWVRAGKPIAGKSDGDGLTFTLSTKGAASWVLRYRIAGRAKELTIGRYPDISLMDARKIAAAKRVEVQQVIDVAAVKQRIKSEAKASLNVEQLSELWLDHAVRPRHQNPQVTERVFKRDILPVLGRVDTKNVAMPDLTRLLARINSSGRPTIANDALRYLKAMFAYGEVLGAVDNNPAERIKIVHAGGSEKPRTRVLSKNELAKLFGSITESRIRFGRENELAIKLLLVLGCRKMELFGSTWSEFDFDKKTWRIPASRVKTNESRELYLASPVIEWLEELRVRACNSPYVFPARRLTKQQRTPHMSHDTTWRALQALKHGLEPFTIHDLRRTSRSLMADLGVPFDVAEKILGHKLPGVASIYDRGGSGEQQKVALEKLADFINQLELGRLPEKIIPIGRRLNG